MQHDPRPLRLSLELRPEGLALSGSLFDEHGDEHAFSGWLGLLTLLEAARVRAEPVSMVA
ncbi:MAG: hypothetical protein M3320_06000 [Actinomycetota bacterium]|nr:hypothetical protein [Actinomycetota bacterium]MDQ5808211.1 hypothetical protein [Actinomycetota bacterium]